MKVLHFYTCANPSDFTGYENEQEETLAKCQLTDRHIEHLIGKHAEGRPPYRLFVPRSILWECHRVWNIPTTLLTIVPLNGKEDTDSSPCDVSILEFSDTQLHIHARRVINTNALCWYEYK